MATMDMGIEEGPALNRRRLTEVGGGGMFPVDRITSLPESIITHILSLLPTKSAFLTSFLSKSWKLRWTKITAFDFDDKLWPGDKSKPEMNFAGFVNLVFSSSTEPIHKLCLRWQSCNLQPIYINIWLNAAIARNIRDLDLAAKTQPGNAMLQHCYEFKLPAALYTCSTLEVLKLRGPFMVKLPNVVRLPKLTELELTSVNFGFDESVEKLISACPVLHSCKIITAHYSGNLLLCKVSSHSLKHFEIYFREGCESCVPSDVNLVIDTPALKILVVHSEVISNISCLQRAIPVNKLEIYASCESSDGVVGLIQACDGVKELVLLEPAMLALNRSSGTNPLPATFRGLTKLVVEVPRSGWSKLLDLIDRCINLQLLDITSCDLYVDEAEMVLESLGGSYWRHPIGVPGCLSSSLKCVYFREFDGLEDEMAMLKFLLDHGSLIERVNLCSNECGRISSKQKLKVLKKVSMLSRSSTNCKILFS